MTELRVTIEDARSSSFKRVGKATLYGILLIAAYLFGYGNGSEDMLQSFIETTSIPQRGEKEMSSPYELFSTDSKKETQGVEVDYGDFQITIARAGSANKKYQKVLALKTKPIRRALAAGKANPQQVVAIMREVFAQSVVLGWKGVKGKDGKNLPFNEKNCVQLFKDLPEFFADIQEQASGIDLFREDDLEQDAGN